MREHRREAVHVRTLDTHLMRRAREARDHTRACRVLGEVSAPDLVGRVHGERRVDHGSHVFDMHGTRRCALLLLLLLQAVLHLGQHVRLEAVYMLVELRRQLRLGTCDFRLH